MAKTVRKPPIQGSRGLELVMRDVLDGLNDSAAYFAYRSTPDTLEILSIEPPRGDPFRQPPVKNKVTALRRARSHDVVDYLTRREARLERIKTPA